MGPTVGGAKRTYNNTLCKSRAGAKSPVKERALWYLNKIMNTNPWVSIIPTLVGIIAGVTTQYVLSFYSERRKRNADLKMQSYIDFIRSVAELGIARNHHDAKKEEEYRIKLEEPMSLIIGCRSEPTTSEQIGVMK
jgi:hypothetical protein